MAENKYDELGQLIGKNVGNTVAKPLQKVNYTYNIRGWLKDINDITNLQTGSDPKDLFAFKLNYNNVQNETGYTGTPLYNGNIAETYWSTNSDGGVKRKYGYKYDNLNRLRESIYQKPGNVNPVPNSYNENLTYDKNGNILSLLRNGDIDGALPANTIDNLLYTYPTNSNQLSKVTDASNNPSGFNDFNKTGDDYTYDANGNLITDKNKKITGIIYNQLNLPVKITFGTTGNISYIYNALGQKVKKTVVITTPASSTTTDYLGSGFQYLNGVLQFFPTAEGYYDFVKKGYVYNYTDHLGNVRLSYQDINKDGLVANSEILEESNYYPFGMKHSGYNSGNLQANYKYKYQGQERQDELGLNWDSFKWRNYDYAIGRFMSIDPLAQEYEYNSPYAFQENKLGLGRELEGLELSSERSQDGKSITLTYRVNVVNITGNATAGQVSQMVSERMCSTENSFSGQTKNGETVTTNVVYDPKATITWEYNDAITIENGEAGEAGGKGYTSPDGNTQVNKTQVNVPNNFEFDKSGYPIVSDKSNPTVTKTGTHEDGHVGGLKDLGGDKSNAMNNKDNSTKITPEQRTEVIKKVELEQSLKK